MEGCAVPGVLQISCEVPPAATRETRKGGFSWEGRGVVHKPEVCIRGGSKTENHKPLSLSSLSPAPHFSFPLRGSLASTKA